MPEPIFNFLISLMSLLVMCMVFFALGFWLGHSNSPRKKIDDKKYGANFQ